VHIPNTDIFIEAIAIEKAKLLASNFLCGRKDKIIVTYHKNEKAVLLKHN
jgi:hypothetical protein